MRLYSGLKNKRAGIRGICVIQPGNPRFGFALRIKIAGLLRVLPNIASFEFSFVRKRDSSRYHVICSICNRAERNQSAILIAIFIRARVCVYGRGCGKKKAETEKRDVKLRSIRIYSYGDSDERIGESNDSIRTGFSVNLQSRVD